MRDLEGWLTYIEKQHWQTIDMGLQRMQEMVERLDLHKPASRIITVAGTNGKGSTCYAAEAMLLQAGLSVGVTLSPHVSRFNERVRINGAEAEDQLLCEAFAAVEAERLELPLTYFEFSALAALWCFKNAQVDVCVLEIGLGGRLDAFNVIDADVAVITSIGLDHQQFLGNTREAIGAEKAGILRPGQHVVFGPDMPVSVSDAARRLALEPVVLGKVWRVVHNAGEGSWAIYEGDECRLSNQSYQQCSPQNLLLAYLATNPLSGLPVSIIAPVNLNLQMPGRMQQLRYQDRLIVCDVAHNPAAAAFLAHEMSHRGWQPALILCGMLKDKDHTGVYHAIAADNDAPWRLLSTYGERGMSADELRSLLPADADVASTNWDKLLPELSTATRRGDVILAFGSFDLVSRVKELIDIEIN